MMAINPTGTINKTVSVVKFTASSMFELIVCLELRICLLAFRRYVISKVHLFAFCGLTFDTNQKLDCIHWDSTYDVFDF